MNEAFIIFLITIVHENTRFWKKIFPEAKQPDFENCMKSLKEAKYKKNLKVVFSELQLDTLEEIFLLICDFFTIDENGSLRVGMLEVVIIYNQIKKHTLDLSLDADVNKVELQNFVNVWKTYAPDTFSDEKKTTVSQFLSRTVHQIQKDFDVFVLTTLEENTSFWPGGQTTINNFYHDHEAIFTKNFCRYMEARMFWEENFDGKKNRISPKKKKVVLDILHHGNENTVVDWNSFFKKRKRAATPEEKPAKNKKQKVNFDPEELNRHSLNVAGIILSADEVFGEQYLVRLKNRNKQKLFKESMETVGEKWSFVMKREAIPQNMRPVLSAMNKVMEKHLNGSKPAVTKENVLDFFYVLMQTPKGLNFREARTVVSKCRKNKNESRPIQDVQLKGSDKADYSYTMRSHMLYRFKESTTTSLPPVNLNCLITNSSRARS